MYKAVLQEKNKKSQDGLIGYIPFYPEKNNFERYQRQYPNLLISCEVPKLTIESQIPLKDLEFVAPCIGLSIGKREE